MSLKYLFTAEYIDGTLYQQGPDDVSTQRPDKSAFFDVHYQPLKPEEDLVRFSLMGEGHRYTVDLRDGHFEVDGLPFRMTEGAQTGCRLVFWKRHTHSFNQARQESAHEVVYRIGWQALIAGRNEERVMEID